MTRAALKAALRFLGSELQLVAAGHGPDGGEHQGLVSGLLSICVAPGDGGLDGAGGLLPGGVEHHVVPGREGWAVVW